MSEFEQLLDKFRSDVAVSTSAYVGYSVSVSATKDADDDRARLLSIYAEEAEKRKKAEEAVSELMSTIVEHPTLRAHATRINHALGLLEQEPK